MGTFSQASSLIRSSAAELLTYIATVGVDKDSGYENIWLTQTKMAALYGVSIAAINQHNKNF